MTVTESDGSASAFTITLDAGRSGPTAAFDTPLLTTSPLRANARVVLLLTMGALPQVLLDGIVTETELTPGSASQHAELRVTGHDVSLLLDRHEVTTEHIGLDDALQVQAIAGPTSRAASSRRSSRRRSLDPPLPIERTPTQQATDYAHLQPSRPTTATSATSAPDRCRAQHALLGAAGPGRPAAEGALGRPRPRHERHGSPTFRDDVLGPELVEGQVQDPRLGTSPRCARSARCGRRSPRCRCGRCTRPTCAPGSSATPASRPRRRLARAQAMTDRASTASRPRAGSTAALRRGAAAPGPRRDARRRLVQ